MTKILVVGGGLTSAVTTSLLSKSSQLMSTLELSVWDKARGCGGRMSTSRMPTNSNCTADLGAQYITATPDYARRHSPFYDELKSNGLLTPLKLLIEGQKANCTGTIDYICPLGSSSIVKHFFWQASVQVKFNTKVSKLECADTKWNVLTESGESECFDAVILTMPVPQILELISSSNLNTGNSNNNENGELLASQLKSVQYSSRYAIALFYDCDSDKGKEAIWKNIKLQNDACAKYITGDSIFRYVSLDSYKRSNDKVDQTKSDGGVIMPVSVVFHSSVPFGIEHIEKTTEEVQPLLLRRINELFPSWPKPTAVKCQKWRFSQVQTAYPGGSGCIKLSEKPLLIAGGDAFTHSNFDGCIRSAQAIVDTVFEDIL